MTNETAVEILKAYKQRLTVSCSNQLDEDIEAFDIAIKALETGEVYMTGKDYNLYLEGYKEGIKDYEEAIKSVRQAGFNDGYEQGLLEGQKSRKRPKAEWVEKEETPASVSYYCSNCKLEGLPITPYCPWCGAKMKNV